MKGSAGSFIRQCSGYVRVSFGNGDRREVHELYRRLAEVCIGTPVSGALLEAGDNDPDGHLGLRDAMARMADATVISPHFRLALVPSTPAIGAIYRETQEALRAVGLDSWVFETVEKAAEWLERRAAPGMSVS